MGKSLWGCPRSQGSTYPTGSFAKIGGGLSSSLALTESNRQYKMRLGGTFSNLTVNIDATGTTRSATFRKNTANGNQTISISDGASGRQTDAVNTDAVVSTDIVDIATSEAGTDPTYYAFYGVFAATSNTVALYAPSQAAVSASSTSFYYPPNGGLGGSGTTLADGQFKIRAPGTFKNFNVTCQTNARASSGTTVRSNINGSAGTCTVTFAASTTGLAEDTTHTDTLANGDLLAIETATGAGTGNFTAIVLGSAIETTNATVDVIGMAGSLGAARAASATVHYFPITGTTDFTTTTESQAKIQTTFSNTVSKLRMNLSANTYSAAGTVKFRKNGADGNQSVSLTASTTGWFEDASNSDSCAGTDDINLSIAGGTSGSITVQAYGVTMLDGTATTTGLFRGVIEGRLVLPGPVN